MDRNTGIGMDDAGKAPGADGLRFCLAGLRVADRDMDGDRGRQRHVQRRHLDPRQKFTRTARGITIGCHHLTPAAFTQRGIRDHAAVTARAQNQQCRQRLAPVQ